MNEEILSGHVVIDMRPLDKRVAALEEQLAALEKRVAVLEEILKSRFETESSDIAQVDDDEEIDERILMDDVADANDPVETLKGAEALDDIFPGFRQWCEVWDKIDISEEDDIERETTQQTNEAVQQTKKAKNRNSSL